jgi:hypothetical protein
MVQILIESAREHSVTAQRYAEEVARYGQSFTYDPKDSKILEIWLRNWYPIIYGCIAHTISSILCANAVTVEYEQTRGSPDSTLESSIQAVRRAAQEASNFVKDIDIKMIALEETSLAELLKGFLEKIQTEHDRKEQIMQQCRGIGKDRCRRNLTTRFETGEVKSCISQVFEMVQQALSLIEEKRKDVRVNTEDFQRNISWMKEKIHAIQKAADVL